MLKSNAVNNITDQELLRGQRLVHRSPNSGGGGRSKINTGHICHNTDNGLILNMVKSKTRSYNGLAQNNRSTNLRSDVPTEIFVFMLLLLLILNIDTDVVDVFLGPIL